MKKTNCPAGHPYTEGNIYRRKNGDRICRTCSQNQSREYQRRKRARKPKPEARSMKIVNDNLLSQFRGEGVCELCERYVRAREPHHILCRGMGGGGTLDVRINLVAICSAFSGGDDCHTKLHYGGLTIRDRRMTAEEMFGIVGRREGLDPEAVEAAARELLRWKKDVPLPKRLAQYIEPGTQGVLFEAA